MLLLRHWLIFDTSCPRPCCCSAPDWPSIRLVYDHAAAQPLSDLRYNVLFTAMLLLCPWPTFDMSCLWPCCCSAPEWPSIQRLVYSHAAALPLADLQYVLSMAMLLLRPWLIFDTMSCLWTCYCSAPEWPSIQRHVYGHAATQPLTDLRYNILFMAMLLLSPWLTIDTMSCLRPCYCSAQNDFWYKLLFMAMLLLSPWLTFDTTSCLRPCCCSAPDWLSIQCLVYGHAAAQPLIQSLV